MIHKGLTLKIDVIKSFSFEKNLLCGESTHIFPVSSGIFQRCYSQGIVKKNERNDRLFDFSIYFVFLHN